MSPVAIVTASDSGIGQECAKELAENGFDVGITYRSDEAGAKETLAAVEAAGRRGEVRRLDLSRLPQAADVIDDLADALGGVDVLVNNAGTGDQTGDFLELPYEEWRQVLDTNLSGAFLCAQRAARKMVEVGNGGRIVNITSVHEHVPRIGASAYCASKGGLGARGTRHHRKRRGPRRDLHPHDRRRRHRSLDDGAPEHPARKAGPRARDLALRRLPGLGEEFLRHGLLHNRGRRPHADRRADGGQLRATSPRRACCQARSPAP